MKISVLYVMYPRTLRDLRHKKNTIIKFCKKKFKKDFKLYIVNNNLRCNISSNKYLFINRNNSYFDFGAWDFLIKNFQEIYKSDWILFINDTFNKDYKNHIKLFNIEILRKYRGKKYAIGHIDAYMKNNSFINVSLNKFQSSYWLRTSFVFFNPNFLKKLKTILFLKKKDIFLNSSPKINRIKTKISDNFYNQIYYWLLGHNLNDKLSNEYRNVKRDNSVKYLRNKISTILNEYLLSRKLEKYNYRLIDIEWTFYNKYKIYDNVKKQIIFATNMRDKNKTSHP